MKLNTSIQPRRTGTVLARVADVVIQFAPGEDGELSAEVADPLAVAELLDTGNFYPANEADYDAALLLARNAAGQASGDGAGEDDLDAADDGDGDGGDDAPNLMAMPLEANTPPASLPGKGKRLRKA